jgi:hypothetical protein
MSKPWDKLRVPPTVRKPDPIGIGTWRTSGAIGSFVSVGSPGLCGRIAKVELTLDKQTFDSTGLRELAEFCTELADQLEPQ